MTQHSATAEHGHSIPGAAPVPAAVPRIALVGVHGFGERHLANLARLEEAGVLELVAVADPNPPAPGRLKDSVAVFPDLDRLLAAQSAANAPADVVILATPIQTHAPLALAALGAGMDVYVEKPPVSSLAQFQEVLAAADAAGRLVQVGFQSLGSQALPAIRSLVESGGIGDVLGFSAKGQWVRTKAYFRRSRWAGKRSLDGTDVVDGVATNALAHAVATALHLAGAHTMADVAAVETDLYRAHDTESDDTSVIRVRTAQGATLLCGLTLCAPEQLDPSVTVHGTLGEVTLFYTRDEVVISTPDGERREAYGRTDLLENLLEARSTGAPLLCSLPDTGAFTLLMESLDDSRGARHRGPYRACIQGAGHVCRARGPLGPPASAGPEPDRRRHGRGGLPGRQPHPRGVLPPPLPAPGPHARRHRGDGPPAAGPRVAPGRRGGAAGCGRHQLLGRPHLYPGGGPVHLAAGPWQHRRHRNAG